MSRLKLAMSENVTSLPSTLKRISGGDAVRRRNMVNVNKLLDKSSDLLRRTQTHAQKNRHHIVVSQQNTLEEELTYYSVAVKSDFIYKKTIPGYTFTWFQDRIEPVHNLTFNSYTYE